MKNLSIANHILSDVHYQASPHFNTRPTNTEINLLVIHCISLPAGRYGLPYIDDLFLGCLDCQADPSFADLKDVKVSSHILIRRDGEIIQYVPFNERAWHAGVSSFAGVDGCNDYSIGIELEGTDDSEFESAQYQSLIEVTRAIMQSYPKITLDKIVGHSDIAPGRKTDPGTGFDWSYYKSEL
ncbi:1,6-anhydro-N-acetylmuramyl-L-alanine amidase AmpD [Catenovulum sp. SM1970]|uniref:1,6-anhydro-N-acetylmuramyl-L-alanine amidase AmpD n=1 Tax=Marinifaba aquimaris TaxID=2741323 RepID=UPI001572280E|nr:1,6-anhydro-N-acetylmuramyl-L-alanine amidase AmpD [Marinifaba aquimaris]NTS76568.1 1,6-anhydro-N-acetylmuramyl-L-alanine amidase AmpD [Marinifaba aquimaris]